MSNFSFVRHVGDGSTSNFNIAISGENIGYISTDDIHVYVNDIEVAYVIYPESPHIAVVQPAPAYGADVLIRRIMPTDKPYANFARGNNFGQGQINNSFLQQLYLTQELLDGFFPEGFYLKDDISLGGNTLVDIGGDIELNGNRITGSGLAVDDGDLVSKEYLVNAFQTVAVSGGSITSEEPPAIKVHGQRWTRCSDRKSFTWDEDILGDPSTGGWIEDNPSTGAISHNEMPDKDAVGAHDGIYRRATTVAEIALGNFKLGDRLEVIDRANAPMTIKVGTPDGNARIQSGDYIAEIDSDSSVDIRWAGAMDSTLSTDAIQSAIDISNGRIIIDGISAFLDRSLFFNGLTSPTVTFLNGGRLYCDKSFNFTVGTRGILKFYQCSNPLVEGANISGATINSLVAPEPSEDGDAGIEYVECTGMCSTRNPTLANFMTWGVIHVNCEDTEVVNPNIYNCILQSGVGHAGVNSAKVVNFNIDEVGLYGVEVETTTSNKKSFIGVGTVSNSQKGVAVVNESYNTSIKSVTAIGCVQGCSTTNSVGNVDITDFTTTDCYFSAVFNNPNGLFASINSTRDITNNDKFLRSRSYDYILKVVDGYGYVQDNDVQRYSAIVGDTVQFINGVQRTIISMEEVNDAVFGRLQKIGYNIAIDSSYVSMSFKSLYNMLNTKYVVLYDGNDVTIKNGTAKHVDVVFESYGVHDNLNWSDNSVSFANEYIRVGTSGDSNGSLIIKETDCYEVAATSTGAISKFKDMRLAAKTFSIIGTQIDNYIPIDSAYIAGIKARITSDAAGTGTPALVVNGAPTLFGGSAPWSLSYNYNATVENMLTLKVVDTIGDFTASACSVTVGGIFTR